MHRARTAVASILVGVASVVPLAFPAEASCAAPDIEATPASASAGATVHIEGKYFASGCNDVISCAVGQPCPPPPLPPPSKGIVISLKQEGRVWHLATVNANKNYEFRAAVTIPGDAAPGPAKFVASGGWSTPFTVSLPGTGVASRSPAGLALLVPALALLTIAYAAPLVRRRRARA